MKKLMAIVLTCAMVLLAVIPVSANDIGKFTPVIDGEKDEMYDQSFSFGVFDQVDTYPGEGFYSSWGETETSTDARAYFLWDDKFLYVYVDITDDDPLGADEDYIMDNSNPWISEAAEIWCIVDDITDIEQYYKLSTEFSTGRFYGEGYALDPNDDVTALIEKGAKTATKQTANGWAAEFALPFDGFTAGKQIKVSLQVNDYSEDGTICVGKQIRGVDLDDIFTLTLGAELKAAEPEPEPEPDVPDAAGGGDSAPEQPVISTPSAPAPRTGDAGMIMLVALLAIAAAAIVVLRKKAIR